MKMPLSQEVEQIFKLRDEFKECHKEQCEPVDTESKHGQEEVAKIAELIKKIKE